MQDNILLNIKQLAKHISLSVATINRYLLDKTIVQPDYIIGKHNKRLWKLSSVQEWLETCSNPKKFDTGIHNNSTYIK